MMSSASQKTQANSSIFRQNFGEVISLIFQKGVKIGHVRTYMCISGMAQTRVYAKVKIILESGIIRFKNCVQKLS